MKFLYLLIVAIFSFCLSSPHPSEAYIHYSSDTDFVANAQFTKYFGGNVRWGDASSSGDWEYAIVDGPEHNAFDVQDYAWGTVGSNSHNYDFSYNGSTQVSELDLGFGDVSSHNVAIELGEYVNPINALGIRARAGRISTDEDIATLFADIVLTFDVDNTVERLGSLIGDYNAEYYLLIDDRLAGGFSVSGSANLQDGDGSNPMYGFKVGYSAVPIPGAALLFLPGLGLFAWIRKKQAK